MDEERTLMERARLLVLDMSEQRVNKYLTQFASGEISSEQAQSKIMRLIKSFVDN